MLFDQMTLEGWRSGQSQQTVNLPSLALRWFKSSSLHQILIVFLLFNFNYSYADDIVIRDPIQKRTYYFLEKTTLSYKHQQTFNMIKTTTNLGLSMRDGSVSGMNYLFFGFSLYSLLAKPVYRSYLTSLNQDNLSTQLPILKKRYKHLRVVQSVSTLVSAVWLSYLLTTDTFDENNRPVMIGVVSQVFSMGVTSFFFKRSEELYLDRLENDYLIN
tara:strand:- start:3025 stop:3669 length:645 start_codon:yes stop_codon:yes gene_type:complete